MKNPTKFLLPLLMTIVLLPAYGQSKKQTEKYLLNSWTSAAETFETGDTIQSLGDKLVLGKKGEMTGKQNGHDFNGSWKYLEESKSLELTIVVDENSEKVVMEIENNSNQVLSLKRRRGDSFRTAIFVEEGSGIVFETVKVPEMSFEEIQAESDANQNADMGFAPTGQVIERVDYNLELKVEANGNVGRSKGDGIVYLLEATDGSQKVVIIRGQGAMPEEWTVLNKTSNGIDTYYHSNLKYDYKQGEKIEVNTKAKVRIASSNAYFNYEDDRTIKFTIVQD